MKGLSREKRAAGHHWGDRWLFCSVGSGPFRDGRGLLVAMTLITLGWSGALTRNVFRGTDLPDVDSYRRMAMGRMSEVARPFSARPLHPWLARELAHGLGGSLNLGFTVLAYLSLLWMIGVIVHLLIRRQVPRWVLLLVVTVPFWFHLLFFAGLPDPLYSALISALLLCMEYGWFTSAALLMFPLMLARESTTLTLVCFVLVAWRELRWARGGLAVGCAGVGALLVRYVSRFSLPNPEHLGGGLYMAGKLAANALRSVGLGPWSNVYPALCAVPAWQMPLHLSHVEAVGYCAWAPFPLRQLLWAMLCIFGTLPSLVAAGRGRWRQVWAESNTALRFCLVYGGVSFFLGPALGTWYVRLIGYGWPLFLVAIPVMVGSSPALRGGGELRSAWLPGVLLLSHLLVCVVGSAQRFDLLPVVMLLQAASLALVLGQTASQARPLPSGLPAAPAC